jgi:voltage-gated potassium channel
MARGQRIRALEGSHRYGLVLVVVVIPIAFSLAVSGNAPWSRFLSVLLFAFAIIIILAVANARRRVQIVALGLLVGVVVTSLVDLIVDSTPTLGLARAIVGIMIALAPFTLVRGVIEHLRAERVVTLDAVFGAVAIYLLIGAFFASVDNAVGAIGSPPFFNQADNPSFETYLYFSYVTLSTVGYGDYTPATSIARALAITEALFGPLYLVTVVAVLVSNIGRPAPRRGGGNDLDEDKGHDSPPRRR